MGLMERVERAEAEATGRPHSGTEGSTRLKERVLGILSADAIATMFAASPERARNEVRSACRMAFENEAWALVDSEERHRLVEELIDTMFGFGPIDDLMKNEDVTEIMVNGTASIYYEQDGKLFLSDSTFSSEEEIRALVDRILGPLGRRIDEASPMVNARLPQGHRVNVVVPPLSISGTLVTVRKFAERSMTLADMREKGSFDEAVAQALAWAVRLRRSIAVSGGTGSGKTTLLNALSYEIPREERIVTIEDAAELRFQEHPHVIGLEARPRNAEGCGEVTIRDLVTNALRMRPDRIIVGECRGAEALDMLQAMNTGHDGSLTTLHANSPAEAVSRLGMMARFAADLPVDVIEASIATALDIIVQTARGMDGSRYVSEIASVKSNGGTKTCVVETLYERGPLETRGRWLQEPPWIKESVAFGLAENKEVEAWRHTALSP